MEDIFPWKWIQENYKNDIVSLRSSTHSFDESRMKRLRYILAYELYLIYS